MSALKLRHLRYFVSVVEAGSISKAAGIIFVAQPALSQQITELEAHLGIALLQRSVRGVKPTAAGQAFYEEALSILRRMEQIPELIRSIGGEPEGTVSVGMSSTLASFLAGPFMEFCRKSLAKVNLRFVTDESLRIKTRISAQQLDLALLFEHKLTQDFVRRPLFRQRLYLVSSRPFPRSMHQVSLDEAVQGPLILPAAPNVMREALDDALGTAALVPNIAAEVNMLSSILSAVQAGIGSTIIPKGDFTDVAGFASLHTMIIDPPIHITASILSSSTTPLSRAAEAVREVLTEFARLRHAEAPPPGADWI
jgi:LysR family nitrogen assimilation transcriptional regulator